MIHDVYVICSLVAGVGVPSIGESAPAQRLAAFPQYTYPPSPLLSFQDPFTSLPSLAPAVSPIPGRSRSLSCRHLVSVSWFLAQTSTHTRQEAGGSRPITTTIASGPVPPRSSHDVRDHMCFWVRSSLAHQTPNLPLDGSFQAFHPFHALSNLAALLS